jgi:hypothetical protein
LDGIWIGLPLGKPYLLKSGLNTGIARKGGGFNPCPNVFGALFYGPLYLGKMPKGGGVKAMPKDLEHFKMFYTVEFH